MRTASLPVLVFVSLVPHAAWADSDSLVSLGVGTAVGVTRSLAGESLVGGEVKARLRVLRALAAEVAYSPAGYHAPPESAVQESAVRVSGLLFLVPTFPVGGYVKAGIEAPTWERVRALTGSEVSYHGGAGIEVYLGAHIVLGVEVLFLGGLPMLSNSRGDADQGGATGTADAFNEKNYRAMAGIAYCL